MNEVCSTHGDKKCVQNFSRTTARKRQLGILGYSWGDNIR
jgi:hypothetical protein